MVIEEEVDVNECQPDKGLPLSFLVLLEPGDDITLDDIKRMVKQAATFDNSTKDLKQLLEELKEVNEIVQEFSRRIP